MARADQRWNLLACLRREPLRIDMARLLDVAFETCNVFGGVKYPFPVPNSNHPDFPVLPNTHELFEYIDN